MNAWLGLALTFFLFGSVTLALVCLAVAIATKP